MRDRKREKGKKAEPSVAPGINEEDLGEDASREDKKRGNYTRVIRVYLDEHDPGK